MDTGNRNKSKGTVEIVGFILQLFLICTIKAQATEGITGNWWPEQRPPKEIVICKVKQSDGREMNLAQSIAGLAAQSLNERKSTIGIWISTPNPNYEVYYRQLVSRIRAKETGTQTVWTLIDRLKSLNIIQGYVLYDYSRGDNSVNLATVYAGLKKGVLIDISQEAEAKSKGLTKLYDARDKKLDEIAFRTVSPQLNSSLLVLANPKFSNNRDYAIAHKCMVYYGIDSLFEKVLDFVKPLSPVIGWNNGDEFRQIAPCSVRGLVNIPADWCMNLSLLSASINEKAAKIQSLDPKKIDWKEDLNYQAFVMSDGDNLQWALGGFLNNQSYWTNTANSSIPMSFTSCPVNLLLATPDVYSSLVATQPLNVSIVEYGGGYYYPDLFGKATKNAEELLRAYAKKININLKRTGTKVFGFICKNVSSPEALKAYQIYAEELEDITGIIAVQYSPYNGGHGKVFWAKNKKGIEIPIVAAKYQIGRAHV